MTKREEQKQTEVRGVDRRSFLRGVGVGAGAAGVAAVVTSKAAEAQPAEAGHKAGGYRETAHVRRVYDLARF